MKAAPIFQALEALRAVKATPSAHMPYQLWSMCLDAHIALKQAVEAEGLTVPVEAPKQAEVVL